MRCTRAAPAEDPALRPPRSSQGLNPQLEELPQVCAQRLESALGVRPWRAVSHGKRPPAVEEAALTRGLGLAPSGQRPEESA